MNRLVLFIFFCLVPFSASTAEQEIFVKDNCVIIYNRLQPGQLHEVVSVPIVLNGEKNSIKIEIKRGISTKPDTFNIVDFPEGLATVGNPVTIEDLDSDMICLVPAISG